MWPMSHGLLNPGGERKETNIQAAAVQHVCSKCCEGRDLFCLAVRKGGLRMTPGRRRPLSWAFECE